MNKRSDRDRESISPRASSNHVFPSCTRVRHVYQMLLKVLDVCACVWVNEWVYRVCLAFAFTFAFRLYALLIFSFIFFLFNKFNLLWVSFGCLYACLPACLGIILEFSVWSLFNIFLHAFSLCLPISPYSYGNYEWELNREKKQQQQQLQLQ